MPRFQRFEGGCYHTVSATRPRELVFGHEQAATLLVESIRFTSTSGMAFILAYAVMPDHLHLLVAPRDTGSVSDIMHSIKRYAAKRINETMARHGPLWQQSFYDRVIRNEEHLRATIEYIHRNPVSAGLVSEEQQYRFSSAHPGAMSDIDAFFGQ